MENPRVRVRSQPLLPDELIREILSWVPVKSLLRFRSVCKSWNSFISDPNFVNSHLQKSPKNTHIILTFKVDYASCDYDITDAYVVPCSVQSLMENPPRFIDEDDCIRLNDSYWICGSCNGLLCLRPTGDIWGYRGCWFQLWNPATRLKSKRSPRLRLNSPIHHCIRFGFGYDGSCDTYKVVVLHLDSESREMEVEVLNMGDNCWRKMLSCPAFTFIDQYDGKFLSGTLSWLAFRRFDFRYRWDTVTIDELVIFSLYLGKETYKPLLLPDGLDEVPKQEPSLTVLRDCLCLFHDYKRTHFVGWQMKEFGVEKSWTQLVNVRYHHLHIMMPPILRILPLCMHENGDGILLADLDKMKVILYNLRDNRAQSFEIRSNKNWLSAIVYVQSLVLPC